MSDLQQCVVIELKKCGEPTPANIVESLSEFVRRSTPCSKFKSAQMQGSMASSLQSTISFTALSSLSILLGHIGHH